MNTELYNCLSNDLLLDCKDKVRACINKSSLKVNCDEILMCIHDEIDIQAFQEWLDYNLDNFKSKSNQTSYFKKSFQNELQKGRFNLKPKVNYLPNTQEFINELRDKGVIIYADDSDWLSVAWSHLLNVVKISQNECKAINQSVLRDMFTVNFDEYKNLLMNHKSLQKYHINWEEIEKQYIIARKNWLELMEELESVYD